MGEQSTSNEGGNEGTSGTTPTAGDGFKPITSQDELNRIIGERVKRAKPADYDDLKAKAARLDDAKAAAERERDAAKAEAARLRIATKFGISDEDADLFLTGTDEATLTKQAERLAQRAEGRKKNGNYVPGEGRNPTPPASDERAAVRQLFGSGG